MKLAPLTRLKRKRVDAHVAKVGTGKLPSVLSAMTVWKIENKIPVSYQSAALYCKTLGLDPYETIIKNREIAIVESIIDE